MANITALQDITKIINTKKAILVAISQDQIRG